MPGPQKAATSGLTISVPETPQTCSIWLVADANDREGPEEDAGDDTISNYTPPALHQSVLSIFSQALEDKAHEFSKYARDILLDTCNAEHELAEISSCKSAPDVPEVSLTSEESLKSLEEVCDDFAPYFAINDRLALRSLYREIRKRENRRISTERLITGDVKTLDECKTMGEWKHEGSVVLQEQARRRRVLGAEHEELVDTRDRVLKSITSLFGEANKPMREA